MVDNKRDTPTEYTQALIDYVTTNSCVLKSSKPMNFPMLYKINKIYAII